MSGKKETFNTLLDPASDSEHERPSCEASCIPSFLFLLQLAFSVHICSLLQHGPALKFCRDSANDKKDAPRSFYSCSAVRDRKLCSLFVWEDEHLRGKKRVRDGAFSEGKFQSEAKRGSLASLKPLTNDRGNAQYLFSDETVAAVDAIIREWGLGILSERKIRVLCLGTPTMHQNFCLAPDTFDSILFDMDEVNNFFSLRSTQIKMKLETSRRFSRIFCSLQHDEQFFFL